MIDRIELEHVSKSFYAIQTRPHHLKDYVLGFPEDDFNAKTERRIDVLRDISFSIPSGQSVGLVGRNGCGKSTVLKLIARILKPSGGTIVCNGRVVSLIELGAGFHPDMTGRENIYLNAAIYGLAKKETDKLLPDILSFSELEDVIDLPVRTYSSGMYMRLGFSCAIHMHADVLLIDEILAVGDAAFQKKCIDRILKLKEEGVTLLLVSHSKQLLRDLCDRVIWLKDGKIWMDDKPEIVLSSYQNER